MPYAQSIQQSAPYEQGIPDGRLIKLSLADDQSAFDYLVKRYHNILASYIGGFFRDREQVLDVLQQVYLQRYFRWRATAAWMSCAGEADRQRGLSPPWRGNMGKRNSH
jgi:hypothetical protein